MNRSTACATLGAVLFAVCAASAAAAPERIYTGPPRSTAFAVGQDIAQRVARPAGIRLEALGSKGSTDNLKLMRGAQLALVQSDVTLALHQEALAGSVEARSLIQGLRVVMPLYEEELHLVVRADSPLNFVHEIRGQRINAGPVGSGSALTLASLYPLLFAEPLTDDKVSFLADEDGLIKLVSDRTIDVVAFVAGQPTRLFADMKPEVRKLIKLLKFDAEQVRSRSVLERYSLATIRSANYPNWLTQDVPALSTTALLVTYDTPAPAAASTVMRLAESICLRLPELQKRGHAKWREVDFALPELSDGLSYYKPTERKLVACNARLRLAGHRATEGR
jgi:uncharacterized protein